MEYLCEYCKQPFFPKRSDSIYCSHSCRQLAYVLRKANDNGSLQGLQVTKVNEAKKLELQSSDKAPDNYASNKDEKMSSKLNELTLNNENPSSSEEHDKETSIQAVKPEEKLFVRTDTKTVNTDKKIPVRTDMETVNSNKTTNRIDKISEVDFKEYQSRYLKSLSDLYNERDNWMTMEKFFENRDEAGVWVSEKYRCLLECLLLFSEMKQIELDSLKEVCNAFTRLIKSRHFTCLHSSYPYIKEIQELRNRIKMICIKAGENDLIKYRPSIEQRKELLVSRFELSQFVPKLKFSELNFKEK